MPVTRTHSSQQGFALIVVTALFVAFALLAAAIIDRSNATKQLDAVAKTREKIARISNALIEYSVFNANHPYPCPASMTLDPANNSFGVSISDCFDSVAAAASGVTVLDDESNHGGLINGNAFVVRGMVPVTTLAAYGVSPEDAFDAWGNRIMYVVDSATTLIPPSANSPRASVVENNTGETFHSPDFIVMSYGKDGLGATPRGLTSIAIPCPTDGSLRSKNCQDNTGNAPEFVQAPINFGTNVSSAAYYDDILSFYGRVW